MWPKYTFYAGKAWFWLFLVAKVWVSLGDLGPLGVPGSNPTSGTLRFGGGKLRFFGFEQPVRGPLWGNLR